jgi:hypothetical protein
MKETTHMFMPGQTITAIFKKNNEYNISKDEMIVLLKWFNEVNWPNGKVEIPQPGQRYRIPIMER